mmetsp:Transcript_26781/g.65125  ORF Transcript_26781/g.65125 Transcript_26781/m.65125 type:complete len:201 (-) Transcript_26781:1845-2447(-)
MVGSIVGLSDAKMDGLVVGESDGVSVGIPDGLPDRSFVGCTEAAIVGLNVGCSDGTWVGFGVGRNDGSADGRIVGDAVDPPVGIADGIRVGERDGNRVGYSEGTLVGVLVAQTDAFFGIQTIVTVASRLLNPPLSLKCTTTLSPETPLKFFISNDSPTSSRASNVDFEKVRPLPPWASMTSLFPPSCVSRLNKVRALYVM